MGLLRNLPVLVDQMPGWAQILVGIVLVSFALASIYGRINPDFGIKIFSRIPKENIRSNIGHIIQYTVMPIVVTIVYLWAWLA